MYFVNVLRCKFICKQCRHALFSSNERHLLQETISCDRYFRAILSCDESFRATKVFIWLLINDVWAKTGYIS